MDRQRWTDRLVGAGVALLAVAALVVVAFLALTRPGGAPDAAPTPDPSPAAGAAGPPAGAPDDLGPGEIWLDEVVLDAALAASADGRLRDLDAVAREVRSGPDGAVAGRLEVEATVPFDVVAAQMGEPGSVVRAADDGQAAVERTVDVLGRQLDVVATGTVTVEAGRLVVEPTSIDIGGPGFLSGVLASVVRELVTIEHTVEGVPEGLVLTDVTVQDDGFRASLEGIDVPLDQAVVGP